jgi:hypothetical protein
MRTETQDVDSTDKDLIKRQKITFEYGTKTASHRLGSGSAATRVFYFLSA